MSTVAQPELSIGRKDFKSLSTHGLIQGTVSFFMMALGYVGMVIFADSISPLLAYIVTPIGIIGLVLFLHWALPFIGELFGAVLLLRIVGFSPTNWKFLSIVLINILIIAITGDVVMKEFVSFFKWWWGGSIVILAVRSIWEVSISHRNADQPKKLPERKKSRVELIGEVFSVLSAFILLSFIVILDLLGLLYLGWHVLDNVDSILLR